MTDNPLDVEDLMDAATGNSGESLWDTVKTIVYAVLIAVLVRTFAFEPFSIPSGSMIPTLLVGDYLFVSKSSYGYSKHSLPFSLPLIPGRIMYDLPKRGDVVVFKLPTDNKTDYIKRIVGLPGDTIQVRGGILHINGEAVKRERMGEFVYQDTRGIFHNTVRYKETLPNGVSHEILEESDTYPADNTPLYRVPDGHFFGMGDNRDNSRDSRFLMDVGYIPKENLVGRAEMMFFSNDGSFWEVWSWPWTLRFERFFKSVD
ncbi:signal peptidase I [Magnetovibrio sp.]|uniref:signal peptidase I n=1 Tax=Magnetovibrio sp. TaxID=2024836 RepID=UPI0039C98E60